MKTKLILTMLMFSLMSLTMIVPGASAKEASKVKTTFVNDGVDADATGKL